MLYDVMKIPELNQRVFHVPFSRRDGVVRQLSHFQHPS